MTKTDSLTIVSVGKDGLLPNFYWVEFNKPIDGQEHPHNEYWLQAKDELDAMRIANELVASGDIKEVTL